MSQDFIPVELVINKTDKSKKERVEIGKVQIFVPTLMHLLPFMGAEQKKDEKGEPVTQDGLPIYVSDEANWIQEAVLAYVKSTARNKLLPGTATLREGSKIPQTWQDFTAETTRDGSALKLLHAFRASFKEWVATQGLAEAASAALVALVSNTNSLQLQNDTTKAKVKARLEQYMEAASEEDVTKYERPLKNVIDACEAKTEDAMNF